jgi:hypothetical protein
MQSETIKTLKETLIVMRQNKIKEDLFEDKGKQITQKLEEMHRK